ncbi:SlyX family protein [Cohaesibacter celericrescens]|uniref:Protein SlyX homolog n=1 Tax=Cohaesibacter celericrescens TaxID=2067669 RepID=A0A2N5XKR3_9HYPH|nr:SlyX family protein [Cohaesibacter celericrescens]PLW75020.1 SlyX protein [Cohaesibacter celericrescens]
MSQELEERVVDLEIQVTHQSTTIEDLSEMVSRQWDTIDRLSRQVKLMKDTLAEPQDTAAPPANQKPPHY